MFLAAAEATQKVSHFKAWDVFMILFTIVIAIGLFRLLKERPMNKFAIGFTVVSLGTFLFLDALMVVNWLGYMKEAQDLFKGVFEFKL